METKKGSLNFNFKLWFRIIISNSRRASIKGNSKKVDSTVETVICLTDLGPFCLKEFSSFLVLIWLVGCFFDFVFF